MRHSLIFPLMAGSLLAACMVSNMENRGARNLIIRVTLNRAARIKFAQIFRFK
jgi:hypothetical protein